MPAVKPQKDFFFLNYGGPVHPYTINPAVATTMDEGCKKYYTGAVRQVHFEVKGVQVTVHTYGIHRALSLSIPEDASEETIKAFNKAQAEAAKFIRSDYHLLSNNCVTSVSKVLNCLDPKMIPAGMVVPWSFDASLKKYCGSYAKDSVAEQFITKYQEQVSEQSFSLFRSRYWTKNRINSEEDIIQHSYKGERTKSCLLELGWVVEDKNKILRPTDKAPESFRLGLENYNKDYEKVQELKKLYKEHANVFSRLRHDFFKDNPDYATALQRIRDQAAINPTGASAQVLKSVNAGTQKNFKASLGEMRESSSTAKMDLDVDQERRQGVSM